MNQAENVWIVDDDKSIRWVLEKALQQAGLPCQCFDSVDALLNRLSLEKPGVILSDIRMPDFDGKQLLGFLDEHMPDAKERVVFVSADVGNPETMEFLKRVERPFVGKPIDLLYCIDRGTETPRDAAERIPFGNPVAFVSNSHPGGDRCRFVCNLTQ